MVYDIAGRQDRIDGNAGYRGIAQGLELGNSIYNLKKSRKIDAAKEALFTAQDPEALQQAQATLMAHDPDYLAGIAQQQNAGAEAEKKAVKEREERLRTAVKDAKPAIMESAQTLLNTPPENRLQTYMSLKDSLVRSYPGMEDFFDGQLEADQQITDEEIEQVAAMVGGFEDPTYQFKTTVGPDGRRQIMGFNPKDPTDQVSTGQMAPEPKGQSVTINNNPEAIPATKSTLNALQKEQMGDLSILDQLGEISKLDPESFTYAERGKGWLGNTMSKFGADVPEGLAESGNAQTEKTFLIEQLFNEYRRNVTGAAAAMSELSFLRKTYLTGDKSPAEFKKGVEILTEKTQRSVRLRNKLMREGFSGNPEDEEFNNAFDKVWTNAGDDDPNARLNELKASGMSEEDAYEQMFTEGY